MDRQARLIGALQHPLVAGDDAAEAAWAAVHRLGGEALGEVLLDKSRVPHRHPHRGASWTTSTPAFDHP